MVNRKENNEFNPVIAIAPGETIKENMEFLGMNQKELAIRLGISEKHLSNIINGKSPITYDTALSLESVLGPSAEFWMNLENGYQLDKARLEREEQLKIDIQLLKKLNVKEMKKRSWIQNVNKPEDKVIATREFFGVSNLSLIKPATAILFRKNSSTEELDLNILAWIRKVELVGIQEETEEFNKVKLRKKIKEIKEISIENSNIIIDKVKELLAECGVAFVILEDIPGNGISGATIWRNNRPIIALTLRGKRVDIFWFTLFHELAHILHHKKDEYNVSYEKEVNTIDIEKEADKLAKEYLIETKYYQRFIGEFNFNSKEDIISYSKYLKISPAILVGRLAYDGYLTYKDFSELRPVFNKNIFNC